MPNTIVFTMVASPSAEQPDQLRVQHSLVVDGQQVPCEAALITVGGARLQLTSGEHTVPLTRELLTSAQLLSANLQNGLFATMFGALSAPAIETPPQDSTASEE